MLGNGGRMQGAGFLLGSTDPENCFTPEDLNDEQRMIAKTAADFGEKEIFPLTEVIESKDRETIRKLMKQAGDLGLLSIDISEEYGGFGLDKTTSGLVAEYLNSGNASFSTVFGAHTGIGTLPIVHFGTPEQKEKYLPGLGSGEIIGGYALTESSAGSDALASKTTAVLSEDGAYYILNGEKLFITNGGYADVFVVFAKVDGDKFTAFIVEKDFEGVSIGPEEKKMGIKGSSTTPLIFQDAKVPVENVLGEVGKGHRVAFNNLNIGRMKLGFATLGGAKLSVKEAIEYAVQRKQFNKPISTFGMIKDKFARMTIEIYVAESIAYRTSGLIDSMISEIPEDEENRDAAKVKALEEYAIEASIVKVMGSEMVDMVVDECLQIHGGYGYTAEYPVERFYRDARINRIFEGTNEINRLLVPGTVLRRFVKGRLPLMNAGVLITADIQNPAGIPTVPPEGPLGNAELSLNLARRAVQYTTHTVATRYEKDIIKHQDILGNLADMMIILYAMDSAFTRAQKIIAARGEDKSGIVIDIVNTYFSDSRFKLEQLGAALMNKAVPSEKVGKYLTHLRRYLPYHHFDILAAKDRIAERIISLGEYKI